MLAWNGGISRSRGVRSDRVDRGPEHVITREELKTPKAGLGEQLEKSKKGSNTGGLMSKDF